MSDEQLIARARKGEASAFAALHHRYAPALVAYARRMLGDSGACAEDVVQEAFLRTYRVLLEQPERRLALRAWLYAVVRNGTLDHLRKQRTQPLELIAATPAPESCDPAVAAAARAEMRSLLRDVAELPERQRAALLMHGVHGVPHRHVGRALHTTAGGSKVLVHRARQALAA